MRQGRRRRWSMPVFNQNLLTLENSSASATPESAVRSALVADVLRRSALLFGRVLDGECSSVHSFVRLRVYGESMLPTLWPGDVVEVTSCSLANVRPGEIVLARHDGRLFLHRMVAATPDGFVLRGDSMPRPDPRFPSDALLGRLTRVIGGRRRFSSSRRSRSALSRALGTVFCHCGPARRLALQLHQRRKAKPLIGAIQNPEHGIEVGTI
jgi:Peptidase S24-like